MTNPTGYGIPFISLLIIVVSLVSCSYSPIQPAALVLRGGKIATVDPSFSFVEAVAVSGDTIIAAGTDSDIGRYVGPNTKVIELKGRAPRRQSTGARGQMIDNPAKPDDVIIFFIKGDMLSEHRFGDHVGRLPILPRVVGDHPVVGNDRRPPPMNPPE